MKNEGEEGEGMKKTIAIIMGVMLSLTGCTQTSTTEYTYNNVNEEVQTLIDNVYDEVDTWQSIRDSGKTYEVSKVNFLYEDDELIFLTFYGFGDDSTGGLSMSFDVDQEQGQLSVHKYNSLFDQTEDIKQRGAFVQASSGYDFDVNGSVSEQKDVLAKAYMGCKNRK